MKTILLFLFLLPIISNGQSNFESFRGTNWDMGVNDIENIFDGELTKPTKDLKYSDSFCPFQILGYKIDGSLFTVDFLFDNSTRKLTGINIYHDNAGGYWRQYIGSLESVLIEKYGEPYYRRENFYEAKWKNNTTIIELKHAYIKNIMSKVILSYRPNYNENKNKL